MSVVYYGAACEPARLVPMPWGLTQTPEPTHTGCPGGQHTPGLLGGWTCPCDCHKPADTSEAAYDEQREAEWDATLY